MKTKVPVLIEAIIKIGEVEIENLGEYQIEVSKKYFQVSSETFTRNLKDGLLLETKVCPLSSRNYEFWKGQSKYE